MEWVGVRAGWPALTGVLGCGASGGPGGQDPPPSASRVIRFHSWAGAGIAPPPPGSCRVRGCPSPQLWVGRLRLPPPPRSRGRTPRPRRSGQHRSPSGRSGGPHELLGVTLQCTLSALHRDPGGLPGRAPAPPRHHPGVPAVRDRGGGTGPEPERPPAAPTRGPAGGCQGHPVAGLKSPFAGGWGHRPLLKAKTRMQSGLSRPGALRQVGEPVGPRSQPEKLPLVEHSWGFLPGSEFRVDRPRPLCCGLPLGLLQAFPRVPVWLALP